MIIPSLRSSLLRFVLVNVILIYFIPFLIYFLSVFLFEFEIYRSEATAMGMVWVLAFWVWFFNRNLDPNNHTGREDSDQQDK